MSNKNLLNKISYGLVGAVLAFIFASVLVNFLGNLNTDTSEGLSFLAMMATPIIVLLGAVFGVDNLMLLFFVVLFPKQNHKQLPYFSLHPYQEF